MSKENIRQRVFSVVIPAWNEERTIKNVINAFSAHPWCHEIIVVSDGSTDKTAELARRAGARVIELIKNVGKGGAMEIGVKEATKDIIFFLDADIKGITPEIISKISKPVLENKCVMSIAIRGRKIYWLNRILHFFPLLGGERVVTKKLWYAVPKKYRKSFKIEIALNYYSKKFRKKVLFFLFPEIRHIKKETKYGALSGFWMRVKMFAEVLDISIKLYIFDRILK